MKGKNKRRKQVVNKLAEFHQRINELEKAGAERKRGEGVVQDTLQHAENAVDTVGKPLLVLDANMKIVSANRPLYQILKVFPEKSKE